MDGTHSWLGYLLTLVVVVAGIALYLNLVAWPYLAVAVIGVTLVVPEVVADWTGGSLGAVGGVLVAGHHLAAGVVRRLPAAGRGDRLINRAGPARAPGHHDVVPLAGAAASGREGTGCLPGIRT